MQLEIRGQFYSDTINVDVVTGVARKPNIENETGNKDKHVIAVMNCWGEDSEVCVEAQKCEPLSTLSKGQRVGT